MKRAVDLVVSSVLCVVLAPVFALIACLVLLDCGRPVLFRHERVGRHGRPFRLLKIRTMTDTTGGRQVTIAGDARVTRSGARLRSAKLDELPQLLNVLIGHMSLVGPRPETPGYVALWPEADRDVILSVRPGITCPASLKYRREAELLAAQDDPEGYYRTVVLPDKVGLYRHYVETRSQRGDLRILVDTLREAVRG